MPRSAALSPPRLWDFFCEDEIEVLGDAALPQPNRVSAPRRLGCYGFVNSDPGLFET